MLLALCADAVLVLVLSVAVVLDAASLVPEVPELEMVEADELSKSGGGGPGGALPFALSSAASSANSFSIFLRRSVELELSVELAVVVLVLLSAVVPVVLAILLSVDESLLVRSDTEDCRSERSVSIWDDRLVDVKPVVAVADVLSVAEVETSEVLSVLDESVLLA